MGVRAARQPDQLEHRVGFSAARRSTQRRDAGAQAAATPGRGHRLEHHADLRAERGAVVDRVEAEHAVRVRDPASGIPRGSRRSWSCPAVRAEQPEDFAGPTSKARPSTARVDRYVLERARHRDRRVEVGGTGKWESTVACRSRRQGDVRRSSRAIRAVSVIGALPRSVVASTTSRSMPLRRFERRRSARTGLQRLRRRGGDRSGVPERPRGARGRHGPARAMAIARAAWACPPAGRRRRASRSSRHRRSHRARRRGVGTPGPSGARSPTGPSRAAPPSPAWRRDATGVPPWRCPTCTRDAIGALRLGARGRSTDEIERLARRQVRPGVRRTRRTRRRAAPGTACRHRRRRSRRLGSPSRRRTGGGRRRRSGGTCCWANRRCTASLPRRISEPSMTSSCTSANVCTSSSAAVASTTRGSPSHHRRRRTRSTERGPEPFAAGRDEPPQRYERIAERGVYGAPPGRSLGREERVDAPARPGPRPGREPPETRRCVPPCWSWREAMSRGRSGPHRRPT